MASLCDYCDKVPLSLKEIMASPSNRYSLGSWPRIFVSRCPLCRLVKRAYCEEYRANPMMNGLPSKNTTLTWFVNGPVNGGAYSIEGVADYWICFAAKSHPSITLALSSNERSNYLCSIVDAELEISRISRWLSICMTTHGEECSSSSATFDLAFPGLQVLRLLDVQRDCLVEVRDLHPYLALSYIWGAVPNFRLTKANLERLLVPGAMRDVFRLPRTIRDAITLAKKLHIQYLWVDALCLIQNDSDDLEQGVNVMDLIYERSLLTIIAACGTDANAGLPGVQTGSRQASRPTLEIEPGIRLGLYSGLDQLLKPSAYYSRGWTFQEHVLCRRALYFVEDKVFFRCRNAEFAESCLDPSDPRKPSITVSSLLPHAVHMENPLEDYSTMLLYYTARALTNQNDVLRAMAGIMRRVSDKVKYRFIQGLPIGALDAFLIFNSPLINLYRRPGFPSYSWCGWRGRIEVEIGQYTNDWLVSCTWIIWYKRSASGIINIIWDLAANESFPVNDTSYIGYRQRRGFQPPVSLGFPTTRTAPTEVLSLPSPMPPYPLLQFWTLAVYLTLTNIDVFRGECHLEGKSGAQCGIMSLDGFEEATFFFSNKPFEIIILSENGGHKSKLRNKQYNVMLLEYNQEIAERRGMGLLRQLSIHDSFAPGPIWKEIILA